MSSNLLERISQYDQRIARVRKFINDNCAISTVYSKTEICNNVGKSEVDERFNHELLQLMNEDTTLLRKASVRTLNHLIGLRNDLVDQYTKFLTVEPMEEEE